MDKKLSRTNSSKISSSKKYIIKKNTAVINDLFGSRLSTEDYSLSLLEEKIINDNLYEKNLDGYPVYCKKIEHPLPSEDEGDRTIFCLNDLTHLDSSDIAKLLYKVNTIALNGYRTELRREINLLERPIAGSRGEGKDYRYAPKNLKNVQYLLTIYRTYHNFCKPIGNTKQTPAMKLGIANKQYTLKDIIYYRG